METEFKLVHLLQGIDGKCLSNYIHKVKTFQSICTFHKYSQDHLLITQEYLTIHRL